MQTLAFFKQKSKSLTAKTRRALQDLPRSETGGSREEQLEVLDRAVLDLQPCAEEVTHLLEFVSLNMAALRKILKKFKKHIEPLTPTPGFLAIEVSSTCTLPALLCCSMCSLQHFSLAQSIDSRLLQDLTFLHSGAALLLVPTVPQGRCHHQPSCLWMQGQQGADFLLTCR